MAKSSKEHIDAVYAFNDPMAIGISQYYDKHPHVKRPVIIGTDGVLVGQKAVFKGKIAATVVQSPEIMGKMGLQKIIECINTKDVKKQHKCRFTYVLINNGTLDWK